MSRIEPEHVDDFRNLYLDHSWRCPGSCPVMTWEQTEELLSLAVPWVLAEFGPGNGLRGRSNTTAKRAPVSRQKPAKVGKGSQHEARRLVRERSGGLCEVCALAPAREWHHRKNRSQGGRWTAANGMDLCSGDHAWITEHPAEAARNGWTVRSHEDPVSVPVLRRGKYVMFDDEGGVSAVEGSVA